MMVEASSEELEVVVLNPTAIIGPNDFKPSLLGNAIIKILQRTESKPCTRWI